MDNYALEFWREWKDLLLAICAKHAGKQISGVGGNGGKGSGAGIGVVGGDGSVQ